MCSYSSSYSYIYSYVDVCIHHATGIILLGPVRLSKHLISFILLFMKITMSSPRSFRARLLDLATPRETYHFLYTSLDESCKGRVVSVCAPVWAFLDHLFLVLLSGAPLVV